MDADTKRRTVVEGDLHVFVGLEYLLAHDVLVLRVQGEKGDSSKSNIEARVYMHGHLLRAPRG